MVAKDIIADNVGDLARRLNKGIVKYHGQPYMITEIEGFDRIEITPLKDVPRRRENIKRVALSDPHLDIEPFKLGYVNYSNRALFVRRTPTRGTNYCMNANNIGTREYQRIPGVILYSEEFHSMLMNRYPSLQEAVHRTSKKPGWDTDPNYAREMAIARLLAVSYDKNRFVLSHSETPIATSANGAVFTLNKPSMLNAYRNSLSAAGIVLTGKQP